MQSKSIQSVLRSGLVGVFAVAALSASAWNAPFTPSQNTIPSLPMQTTSSVLGQDMYGEMHYMTAYSSTVTAVGAESPYSDPSESSVSRVRRVSPGGGIGEPGAAERTPIGDVPMGAMLLALGVYGLLCRRRQKARR